MKSLYDWPLVSVLVKIQLTKPTFHNKYLVAPHALIFFNNPTPNSFKHKTHITTLGVKD